VDCLAYSSFLNFSRAIRGILLEDPPVVLKFFVIALSFALFPALPYVFADLLGATNVVRRLFFYMGNSTEPCESGSNGSNPVDRGYDETKGLSAIDEKLLDKQLRSSAPRSLLQTEAVA